MDIFQLFNAIPGNIAQGVIWGLMALGVYITFRILDFADLSVDGSFATGGAVTVVLVLSGWNVGPALVIAFIAGVIAGLVTGGFIIANAASLVRCYTFPEYEILKYLKSLGVI